MPKDLLYSKLDRGTRKTGCPLLRFNDVCKRDMKSAAIDIEIWELMAKDLSTWRHLIKEGNKHAEHTRNMRQVEKRNIRKAMAQWHYLIQFSNMKDVIRTVIQKSVFLRTKNVVQ